MKPQLIFGLLSFYLILSPSAQAEPIRSAGLYYTAPEIIEVTPLFKYGISNDQNGLFNIKSQSQQYGMKAEYGINDYVSVGSELVYGMETANYSYITNGASLLPGYGVNGLYNPYNSYSPYGYGVNNNYFATSYIGSGNFNVRNKGLLNPKLYMNTHYASDNFRIHGNLITSIKTEARKEGNYIDDGNMSSGTTNVTVQGGAEYAFNLFSIGGMIGRDIWRDNTEIQKSIIPTSAQSIGNSIQNTIYSGTGTFPYTTYTFKGGYETTYKAFIETSAINSMKIGLAYSRLEKDSMQSNIDYVTQSITYGSETNSAGELYGRFRVNPSSAVVASYFYNQDYKMPFATNAWNTFISQSFALSFSVKF